jgi:hypothetical protein
MCCLAAFLEGNLISGSDSTANAILLLHKLYKIQNLIKTFLSIVFALLV